MILHMNYIGNGDGSERKLTGCGERSARLGDPTFTGKTKKKKPPAN